MSNKKLKVINLLGAPGSGKSTAAAGLFHQLKLRGINCELITEYIKDKIYEQQKEAIKDQIYISAKQYHKQFKLKDKVDIVITDAPLILSMYYGKHLGENYLNLIKELFNEFDNYNFYLNRMHEYKNEGRFQNEKESEFLNLELKSILYDNNIEFTELLTSNDLINNIIEVLHKENLFNEN